ncbi:hypothetical protein BKA61DRAFT_623125 [Leptodontidium sp. MPI-SDFR-AT-0119]|nr:hypothetical protein BKA61DRAFT_623125 [Leptodontidium sp. MPI-SDFR-AT-0119]
MEEELAELRLQLAQSEIRAGEEQRRREAAEAIAKQSQPQNLVEFLKTCHGFSLALQVVTDETLTTQGDTTKPAGRLFPQRIVPWDDFPLQQETVWEKLSTSAPFTMQQVYPSKHQLEYVQQYLDPISSELGLRHFARDTVENPVRTLIEEIYRNVQLRDHLQLEGTLMFESHTNLGKTSEVSIQEEVEHVSLSESHTSEAGGRKSKEKGRGRGEKDKRDIAGIGRGLTGSADQFCIYELANGQRVPVVLVEYKAPHKLPLAEIIAGLTGEIRPAEEVINKDGEDLEFLSKSLLAAVITQLFSSMIGKGVQRGYIFTAEATIFLHIPDDPATVQYHLSIPSLDFQDNDDNRFHRTSVAQIAAFALNAFAAKAPGQSWHDAAAGLDTWAVEYIDILKKIPETVRKAPPHSPYKPGRWKGFFRSPIRTRARGLTLTCNDKVDHLLSNSSGEGDDNNNPPSPTPKRPSNVRKPRGSASAQRSGEKRIPNQGQDTSEAVSEPNIADQPYCTQKCLIGLASDGALDEHCPNLKDHRGNHPHLKTFLGLIRIQLARDRGRDADCKPLYVKGSRGALFKVRLSSHGYTFVAKAMKEVDRQHLDQEAKVYARLHSIEGIRIPVCLGILDLDLPYYYDYGIYDSMLILSWAGQPLHQYINQENKVRILEEVDKTLTALHEYRVLHKDVEPRNWLWDGQRVMLVDFERAEIRARPPLTVLSPNRKRTRQGEIKDAVQDDDEFVREIRKARSGLSRCVK